MKTETLDSSLFPEHKIKTCQFCKEQVTLTRKGDGAMKFGLRDFWYESDHKCPQRETFRARTMPKAKKR